ncbi:MAG: MotA/TolQ/ExbB proton channel family protein [Lachnospiraceae bacterium]|nr:MotA/TolQ/ExbB proton channel family protein [Lachnospiraceae bacterium]
MYIRRFISVLAAALSIGVCVFITYISRDVDFGTIVFNLSFLGVMLLMLLAACLVGLRRLLQVCKGLKRGIAAIENGTVNTLNASNGNLPIFQNSFLDDCYQQYCRMLSSNPEASCDIRNFINEDAAETYVHRGILEMIPDILTSLGILGTFVGLVMGLRSFDPSGYEQMAGSVTPLINGIKVAFITSIYGISLSLAFSFNLRSEFANLSSLTEEFLDAYYLNVRPPYEVDSLSRLLDGQKSREEMTKDLTTVFVEQMAKSFEEVITPAYSKMTEGINHVVETFTESQAQVMTQVCEAVVQQMRSELNEDFAKLSETIQSLEKAQHSYTDFMDRSMVRMQQTFVTMQDNMAQMDQYNAHSFDKLNAAQQEALRINQEQKDTYQDYIRFMYQSIEKFSEVWEKNSEKLQLYSDEIGKMGPVRSNQEILDSLHSIALQLKDIQKRQAASDLAADLAASEDMQAEMLRKTLRKLDELTELVDTPRLFRSRRKK